MHLTQEKLPSREPRCCSQNESTNLANTEAYFLCRITATLTQLAVSSSRPNVHVEQTSRCCYNDTYD